MFDSMPTETEARIFIDGLFREAPRVTKTFRGEL